MSEKEQKETREKLTRLFNSMMHTLHELKGAQLRISIMAEKPIQDFINAHADILDSAFQTVPMSDTMRRSLQRSDYIFSGMKTFHELNEAFPSLLNPDGTRKPFERFLNDVKTVDETYNNHYLRAEYNFAQTSATMAAKWEQFLRDGDRYYLQYRTVGDDRVRPEHAALNRVTLPITDEFWQHFFPPNGWNCRCNVIQVSKHRYTPTDHDQAMELGAKATARDKRGIFRFNPGIERTTFPDYNPYTTSRCRNCDLAKGKLHNAKVNIPDHEACQACELLRKCEKLRAEVIKHGKGTIEINHLVNRGDNDYQRLMQVAEYFAEQGEHVTLTPKMTRPQTFDYDCIYGSLRGTPYYGKCPDLKIGEHWYEHEGFITSDAKNAFRNMMRDGLRQSNRLIIDKPDLTERYMRRSIIGRIERGEDIQEVWLRETDGKITLLYKKNG